MPNATIAILSYDRIALLERTLRAAMQQTMPAGLNYDILVADNHPNRLAEPIVARLACESTVPVRYVANRVRNISIIRNAAIDAVRGVSPYIAFADDDERPDPDWLASLLTCIDRTGADAAFGPKYPEFEAGIPPAWDQTSLYFTCDFHDPPDTPIVLSGRLRKPGKGLGSGNSIFRMSTCFADAQPFDPAFGLAGGEDTELFFRLQNLGRRFVWCPDARVSEFMQTGRATIAYMRTRLKRGSQHYAASRVHTSRNKLVARTKVAALGLAQIIVYGALFVCSADFLRPNRVRNRFGIAKGIGKLTYRRPIGFIAENKPA